jgi:hypothetical protein
LTAKAVMDPNPVAHSESAKKQIWTRAEVISAISSGAAVAAMGAAIAAAIFTGLALVTSRRTLIAAERPWLAVTEAAPAPHGGEGLTSLDFTDRGAEFGIQYKIKNFGKSPALKVVAHLKTYLEPFNNGQATNMFAADFVKHQEEACDDDAGIPPDYNETVYPDVDRPLPIISPDAVWDDMSKRPIGQMKADSTYLLVVAGCFSYAYYADGHVYHTYVANGIAGRNNGSFALFDIKKRGANPAGSWQMIQLPMGKTDD